MPVKKNNKSKPSPKTKKANKTAGKGLSWPKALFIAILVLLALRTFFLQSFVIQNTAMDGTFQSGDWIIINKAAYGSRMPITPLSVPFSPLKVNSNSPRLYSDAITLPYFRLSGYSNIHNNDIIAFNYPDDENTPIDKKIVYAKRCVAIPGDTLIIRRNELYINNQKVKIDNLQFLYKIVLKGHTLAKSLIDKYSLNEGGAINNFGEYNLYISEKQAEELSKETEILSITKERKLQSLDKGYVFPQDVMSNWTLDNYGPIVVPKAGFGIRINKENINIYRKILEQYEKCTVAIEKDKVLINNKSLESYFFKYNYFFMLDDNRDNAKDSRLWGFLPETHIIGKVAFIASSFDPSKSGFSKIRWSRTFKRVK